MSKKYAELVITKYILNCICGNITIPTPSDMEYLYKITCSSCSTEWTVKRIQELKKTSKQIDRELGF